MTVSHTAHQAMSAEDGTVQLTDEDKELQEKIEEEVEEKRDREHWNESQSDGL